MIFHKKLTFLSFRHPLPVLAALLVLTSPSSRLSFFLNFLFQFLVLVHILIFVFLHFFSVFFVQFLLTLPYFYSKRER
jgi:hypothetical protein